MGIKALILRCENGADDMRRHFVQREFAAKSLGDAGFPQRNAISVEERNTLHRRPQQRGRNRHELQGEFTGQEKRRERCQNRSGMKDGESYDGWRCNGVGSARVPRVGDGVSPSRTFADPALTLEVSRDGKMV